MYGFKHYLVECYVVPPLANRYRKLIRAISDDVGLCANIFSAVDADGKAVSANLDHT